MHLASLSVLEVATTTYKVVVVRWSYLDLPHCLKHMYLLYSDSLPIVIPLYSYCYSLLYSRSLLCLTMLHVYILDSKLL